MFILSFSKKTVTVDLKACVLAKMRINTFTAVRKTKGSCEMPEPPALPSQICPKLVKLLYIMIDQHTKNFSSISFVLFEIWIVEICNTFAWIRGCSFSATFRSSFLQ